MIVACFAGLLAAASPPPPPAAAPTPCPRPAGSNYTKQWCSVITHPMPQWFEDAKFGIYAHWGPYSVPAFGSEWYSRNMYVNGSRENKHSIETYGPHFGYKDLIPLFTAHAFNATEWASIYHRAGARYAGPVAEHADGFAMFKSSISHYNAFEMGPRRDVVGELASAIRAQGLRVVTTLHHQWLQAWYPTYDSNTDAGDPRFQLTADQGGLYGAKVGNSKCFGGSLQTLKSPPHPAGCEVTPRFNEYFVGKVHEVVDQYQPDVLYFDAKMDWIDEPHRLDFLTHYYNSDLAWQKQGSSAGVITTYKIHDLAAGAGALDFERGGSNTILPNKWQTDDAMDRGSWSWVNPPNLKNESELIDELVDIVSKNGNLLLDIPPHADGSIDPRVRRTLYAIGDWLEVNGQAIFATKPWFNGTYGEGPTKISPGSFHEWPTFTSDDFRFTLNGRALFATAMAWSPSGRFVIKCLNSSSEMGNRISSLSLLGGSSGQPAFKAQADGLHIGPVSKPGNVDHAFVFRMHLDGSRTGFVAWDRPDPTQPKILRGSRHVLRWLSGANPASVAAVVANAPAPAPAVAIEMWAHGDAQNPQGAWRAISSEAERLPDTGSYEWEVPLQLVAPLLLRVRALGEQGVEHVAQMNFE